MITSVAMVIKHCLYYFKHCLNCKSIGGFLQWDRRRNEGPVSLGAIPPAQYHSRRRTAAAPSPRHGLLLPFGDLAKSFSNTFSTPE